MKAGTEYTIAELIAATGVSARTIRSWSKAGLLPEIDFRGPATSYGPEHLLRIQAVQALRKQRLGLRLIKRRLAKATLEELERIVSPDKKPLVETRPPPKAPSYPSVGWERIVLADGLEVHVRADGGPLLRRIADEIYRHYGS